MAGVGEEWPDSRARREEKLRSWSGKILGTLVQLWEGRFELGKAGAWLCAWSFEAAAMAAGKGRREEKGRVPTAGYL